MGYRLFIQGVSSLNYSVMEILELVRMVNEIQPYSFGIVDTYGAMYSDDVSRLYGLIFHNMNPEICIYISTRSGTNGDIQSGNDGRSI